MQKEFNTWNNLKQKIEYRERKTLNVKIGEIYWCHLGLNIGREQDGKNENFERPVLILKKFSKDFILIAPLTTKTHDSEWYFKLNIFDKPIDVVLNQIKPIDTKRLLLCFRKIHITIIKSILEKYWHLIRIRN